MYSSNHSSKTGSFANGIKRNVWRISVFTLTALAFTFGVVTTVTAARLYAPVLAATKTDTFVGTHDGDGKADPGETIQYNVVVNNTGADPATGVTFTDTIDSNTTLVGSSTNVSPLAGNDTYATIGNTLLEVGVTASGSPSVKVTGAAMDSLFDNDTEFLGDTFTLTSVEADISAPFTNVTTEQGGLVTVEADGNFSYTPPVGFSGADGFDYVISDDGAVGSSALTGTAHVTINVNTQEVWYVNNDATAGGLGRSSDPFDTLLEAQTASGPNDTIFVMHAGGDLTGQNAGIILKNGQRLLGEAVPLEVAVALTHQGIAGPNPTPLHAAGSRPHIGNAAGDGVTLSTVDIGGSFSGVEMRGLDISGTGAGTNAVAVTTGSTFSGSFELSDNVISAAGAEGVDVNGGGSGTLTIDLHDNTVTATGNGIDIERTAGNVNIIAFDDNVINGNTGGTGINIFGNGASVLFDVDPGTATYNAVAGGATVIGASGNRVGAAGMVLNNVRGDLIFVDLDSYADSGAALSITGTNSNFLASGTGTRVTANTATPALVAIGGPALSTNLTNINIVPSTFSSSNSTATGVSLVETSGTLTAPSGSSITDASGADFFVDGNLASTASVSVTYPGTITDDVGTLVQIVDVTGGSPTYAFSGAITDGNDGDGSGITLTNNDSATIRFSGGLLLSTSANPAFAATGGAVAVEVCDENPCNAAATGALVNTITTTTGTALNVVSTTVGANNLEFRSISSNGATNGIVLNGTGSSGNLAVKGNGGSCASAATCTGGAIQNATIAVSLTNTTSPSIDHMFIQNTSDSGIKGTTVTNFSFTNGMIDNSGTGLGVETSNIAFNTTAAGTENNLSGVVTITGNTLTTAYYHGIDIFNFNGTISDVNISNNIITSTNSTTTSKGTGIRFIAFGSASTVANVTKATIANNTVSNFPSGAGIMAQGGNANASGTAGVFGTAGSVTNVINITGNIVKGFSAANRIGTQAIIGVVNGKGQGNFNISNNGTVGNPLTNTFGTTIAVSSLGNANVTAMLENNVIVANNTVGSQGMGVGTGVTFAATDTPTLAIVIRNNNISQTDGNGILAVARDATGQLNITIKNNTVAAPLGGVRPGIRIDAGNTTSADDAVCLDISGNTSAGSGGSQGLGLRKQGTTTTTNDFGVVGMSATSTPGVETYVNGLNPAGSGTLLISATSGFSNCSTAPVGFAPNQNRILASADVELDGGAAAVSVNTSGAVSASANLTAPKTFTVASGSAKLSKQATWAKAPSAVLFGNTPNTGTSQLISAKLPAPLASGETVTVPAFTLPAGKSVTIVFQVDVNGPQLPLGTLKITNQGTVGSNELPNVLTTNGGTVNCEVGSETCTPVDRPDTTVTSITRQSANPTTNPSVTWQVVFANPVDFLAASNFSLVSTGTVSGATLSAPTETSGPPSTTWNISATGITGDGTLELTMVNDTGLSHDVTNLPYTQPSSGAVYTIDNTPPTVTINQAVGQLDPTGSSPVNFTVVFNEAVTGFDNASDVTLSGTAGATTAVINEIAPMDGTTYNVAVSGMTVDGTVIASVPVNVAQDLVGNNNSASTSTDNSVLYDTVPPSVTINQAIGQADPTNTSPINFTVVFSEPVTDFDDASDVTLSGTAGATTVVITEIAPMDDTTYNVAVSGMTSMGTVIASVPVGAAVDQASQANTASTSTDDTVTYGTDLSITKTDGVTTAIPGASVTYTITASNAGPNADPAATVTDTFPASLTATWTCVGAGGGTCTAGPVVGNINDTVNLPVGGSVTYTVSANISASATGTLANTATVTSSVADTNAGNNSATDTDTLTPQADLAITKTDGVTTAVPGGSVTYTITASNAGPSDTSATVADTFPASLTATWTCVGAGGGTCTAGPVAGNISDSVSLPAGGSVTYTVTANINPSATGSLANTATVATTGGTTDPNPANDSATDTDTLTPQADLAITKTDGVTVVIPGGSTTYTITASNSGPSDAPGATVADTFPASLTASWTCVGAGGGTCTAGPVVGNINDTVNLPVGGSVTYTVSATISGAASGSIVNTATVSAPGGVTDPVPGNNSATDTDTVIPPVAVTINQKTSAPAQADPTNASSINFTVIFGSTVTDFDDASDVTLSGTAGATTVVITGGPTTYNVAVSGMTADGTVIADIPAGVATGTLGQPNAASTSTDNTVIYDGTAPDTTILTTPANPTNDTAPTFTFDATDIDATFECQLDGGGFSGCSSPRSYTVAEGSHTFQVRAIDTVGNIDPTPASFTWLVDVTAPDTIIDTNPTNPSNTSTGNFTFHGEDGSGSGIGSVECKLDSGSFAACDTLTSHAFTGLSEGSHTVQFRATDNAGNTDSTPVSYTWTVDTVEPTTTILTNPTNPTTSTSASFTFDGSDTGGTGVASFQCQIDGGGYTTCTTPKSYTSLADGSHTFDVRAVDNAGNTDSTPASFTWVVDATAPNTTIDTFPANPTNSTTANFTFTNSDGSGTGIASVQCKLDAGAFTACDTLTTQSYSGLANGSHTFQVRATDLVGNTDATPASYTWVVDTTLPTVVVSSVTTSPTNISPITITITFSESVTGFTPTTASGDIVIGGVGGTDANPLGGGTTYTFDLTPSGQGAVTVTVPAGSAQDAATNMNTVSNTFSITYDTVAPTVTINQASGQSDPTSLSPINFTVVFNEAISVASFTGTDITLGGTAGATTAVVTQIAPMDGTTFNVAVSGMTVSGTVTASMTSAKVTDVAGNSNAASTSTDGTVTFDATPLTVTINQAAGQTDPDFANAANKYIHFTAVFSEPVTGFAAPDISFAGTTLMGTLSATVTQIAPMDGTTYDVAVKGMIPKGTVFVSIPANGATSIARLVGNQASTSTDNNIIVDYVLVEFTSTASKDGWVLESTETSGVGGSLDAAATTSKIGDDASDRQYRSVVDFATGSLPDSAVLFSVNLRIIEHSITGTNPFTTHGLLKSDIKSGFFSTAGALQNPDFQDTADKSACNFESVPEILESIGTAYRCIVFESAYPYINLTGSTQFRLRFATDDNNDMSADIFNFYSGDYGGATQRPRLFVKYYIPPAP